jgi:hypothetical protein
MANLNSNSISGASNTASVWVNFFFDNGVGIRNSFNVSSVSRVGQGLYYLNFAGGLGAADYAVDGSSRARTDYVGSNWAQYVSFFDFATTSVGIQVLDNGDQGSGFNEDPWNGPGQPGHTLVRVFGRYGL